jgi:hypothetical protein
MCRLPVTLGGGMTIVNASAFGSSLGLKAPEASQAAYRRGSTDLGSKVFSSLAERVCHLRPPGETGGLGFWRIFGRKKAAAEATAFEFQRRRGRLDAAAGDAVDFFLDLGLDDARQVLVQPLLEQRAQQFAHDVFEGAAVLGHQQG